MTNKRTRGAGVPPLQNPDVTGLTKPRQDDVIRESGTAERSEAAEQFLEEQKEQARETGRSGDRQGAARVSGSSGGGHPGLAAEDETELKKHWDPKAPKKR